MATSRPSKRQCCVVGCYNRKGYCPVTVCGQHLSGCPAEGPRKNCPNTDLGLPTLHAVNLLHEDVRKVVLTYVNRVWDTRFKRWEPKKTDCICNVHFPDFKGPTRTDKLCFPLKDTFPKHSVWSVVPNAYAKPRLFFGAPRSKRKRFDSDDARHSLKAFSPPGTEAMASNKCFGSNEGPV